MRKSNLFRCLSVFVIATIACLQLNAQQVVEVGEVQGAYQRHGNSIFFTTSNAKVSIELCKADVVRVRTSWTGTFKTENHGWMVQHDEWPAVTYDVQDKDEHYLLSTAALDIAVWKRPFRLEFMDKSGRILNTEKESTGAYLADSIVVGAKTMLADEHFFGFGERMDAMDRKGQQLRLNVGRGAQRPHIVGAYNILEANYSPVPFFMSTRGYGIFFHTAFPSDWDMGNSDRGQYSFSSGDSELDYYFIYGPELPHVLANYTDLTGKSPLLPRFAMGLHLGTYSGGTWRHEKNTSPAYVINLVKRFRELGIPLDILHFDSTWRIFGKHGNQATSYEWRETFPNPESMFDSLYNLNIQMAGVHVRSRLDNGNELTLLDEAVADGGVVYPSGGDPNRIINFFDPKAVDWWWDNAAMRVAGIGAMFMKTDEGSSFGRVYDSEAKSRLGFESAEAHNLFPLAYAKAPYEKFAQHNQMRGMNHTREGYAGIQRYPFIFAGDWPSEWQYFAPIIKAGLNMGLSGVGYWSHCMGGFEYRADTTLYIRWTQFGLMSSVAHLFGMDHPGYKEPWDYGDEATRIFTEYANLRYRLTPYLYSHAYDMYQTGMPLMRALVLEYQDDPNVYHIGDQYMLGKYLMVCPVTEKNAKTRIVYLPKGEWINYWTGERIKGGKHINVVTPIDQMPMFVKAGAILPMQEQRDFIGTAQAEELTFRLYPGDAAGVINLYDDDGKTTAYQDGAYSVTTVQQERNAEHLRVSVSAPTGPYKVQPRNMAFELLTPAKPQYVRIDGKDVSWDYNEDTHLLMVDAGRRISAFVLEVHTTP